MNVSYLFKDFLRLEDVGEYLNQYGYSYDPEEEGDYYRLKNTILDLYHENKLNVVFYYDDFALIKTLRFAKDLSVEEVKEERFEHYISGYFHALEVKSVIEHECNLNIIRTSYSYYHLYDKEQLPISDNEYKVEAGRKFTSIEFGDNEIPSVIEFSDLRFPKADLDKLFNEKNSELKSVKDELADLKSQLSQAKAELANKPANKVQLQGIAKYNADKAYVISTSKALANYIWSMDTNKAIRTGDMVQQIRHVMHNVAPNLLPDDKAIRDWLSGIAPDYAKKRGKTPKDAPREIPLIMKK